ncbi:MAG: hypothetical protein J6R14_01520 [Bacteroidales bacterium]|nr:hypothetical protein [Bacteroidales bacterium]MBR6541023.1 hypothetical protein [Bacteroidales bacterium]
MNKFFRLAVIAIALLSANNLLAQQQQQEPPKMDPIEMASEFTEKLITELELNSTQAFYVDSVLQVNYTGLIDEFEEMKSRGSQDGNSYKAVSDKWEEKNVAAFRLIMDEQQVIKYLRLMGKGKEYKKGKDGKYYKKEKSKEKDK